MTNQHPITPPPELVQEWWESTIPNQSTNIKTQLCIQAAQWGSDQELEACCELTRDNDGYDAALGLRASRRPEPPSLKEQALEALEHILHNSSTELGAETIRRALEQLND